MMGILLLFKGSNMHNILSNCQSIKNESVCSLASTCFGFLYTLDD